MKTEEILEELGKYLEKKGWKVLLIEEEGILKGDDSKKNSFRLSFKFIGNKFENPELLKNGGKRNGN